VLGLIPLAIILLLVAIYFAYKFFTKKDLKRETYLQILKDVDLTNSKESAYLITKYGRLLVKEESEKKLLEDLIVKLEEYKYRKDVKELSQDLENQYRVFLGAIDG
ncbi:MAG: hypothetical protein OIF32_02775, partial [Campylobacterales bacterium]|nr:hypothetical protein [Campylobacterales bacterium]